MIMIIIIRVIDDYDAYDDYDGYDDYEDYDDHHDYDGNDEYGDHRGCETASDHLIALEPT